MAVVFWIAQVAFLVCWIMVLVKMFQKDVVQGVIGLICGIWAFIWGWMNVDANKNKQVMMAWTVAWIVMIVAGATGGVFSGYMGG